MSYVQSKDIVSKIIRDYQINNLSWVEDCSYWIKEAIQAIGTNGHKVLIKKAFDLTNKSLSLPCDLEDIVGIVKDGCYIRFQGQRGFETLNMTGEIRPYVNNNAIQFNTDGQVKGELYYMAYIEDCDCDPLIVNHIKVVQAVTNYVVMMLMLRGMKHSVLSYQDAYTLWNKTRDEASNYMKFPAPYEISFVLSEFTNPISDVL